MESKTLTGPQLVDLYGDSSTIEKLLDLRALSYLLRECIIADDYKPTESLRKATNYLSKEGIEVRKRLGAPKGSNAKQVQASNDSAIFYTSIHCLLELFHTEPLLDLNKVDPQEIADAISFEVKDARICYPLIFGRELYDAFAESVETEVTSLEHPQTMELLRRVPMGVFHLRHYLVGPLGVVRTPHTRNIPPTVDPYLQHSADHTRTAPHRVWLKTSHDAPVNRYRSDFRKALKAISLEKSDWSEFFTIVSKSELDNFDPQALEALPFLIGDALSDSELRSLAAKILEEDHDNVLNVRGDGDKLDLEDSNRAVLLQVIFCSSDRVIQNTLDELVSLREITIPAGEIRAPVLNGRGRFGYWGTRMEIGEFGTRTVSSFPGAPLLRLESLLSDIGKECTESYREDIAWRYRSLSSIPPEDRLGFLVRNDDPISVIEKMILFSRQATEFTAEKLGIDLNDRIDDSVFSSQILWRLGFGFLSHYESSHHYRKLFQDTLNALSDDGNLSEASLSVRAISADLMPEIERYMREFLSFLCWFLFNDHYLDHPRFHYTPESAKTVANRVFGLDESKGGITRVTLGEVSDRLRQIIKYIRAGEGYLESARRDISEYPRFADRTDLQLFPFKYRSIVPTLAADSIEALIEEIDTFAGLITSISLAGLRNDLAHFNPSVPSRQDLKARLRSLEAGIERVEEMGLFPVRRRLSSVERDSWNRSVALYSSDYQEDIRRHLPSKLHLAGVPITPKYALIVPIARYKVVNELVMFNLGVDSEYTKYWEDFPVRPKQSRLLDANDTSTVTSQISKND